MEAGGRAIQGTIAEDALSDRPFRASLSRMAQASLSTATQSHLLHALRDVPTSM